MLSQLKAKLGKQVTIELSNGSKIFGELLEVGEKAIRLDTDEGIATLLVDSVQIIWENQESSLAETDFQEILGRAKETVQARYLCLGFNGFLCPRSYICRPPHGCNRFFCPGRFFSAFPPLPPDVPCVAQFVAIAPQRELSGEEEKSGKGDKEIKEQGNG